MKRTVFARPLAVLAIAGLLASSADAQEAKKTRGKVTVLTATSLTLDVAGAPSGRNAVPATPQALTSAPPTMIVQSRKYTAKTA